MPDIGRLGEPLLPTGTLPRFTPLDTFQKGISLRTSGGLALDSKSGIVIERGGVEGQSCFEQDRWIFNETIEKAGFAFEGHSRLISKNPGGDSIAITLSRSDVLLFDRKFLSDRAFPAQRETPNITVVQGVVSLLQFA